MRKIFVSIALLFVTSLMADGIHWAKDYKSGMLEAQKENKPVMFIISSHSCKYCLLLESTTFQNPKIIKVVNKDFIAIRSWTDKQDYIPMLLAQNTPGLPGIWFLLTDGKPMYQPLLGYLKSDDFLGALAVVKTEFEKSKQVKGKK